MNAPDKLQELLTLTREPFPAAKRVAWHVCEAARRHGLLTRGVGSVLILMPPYCTTPAQAARMVNALYRGLRETVG